MMRYAANFPRRLRKGIGMRRSTQGSFLVVDTGATPLNSLKNQMFQSDVQRFFALGSDRDVKNFAEIG